MGFVEKMLSDLVRNATGVNARPLIRKIGAKNILMIGGAALAGGLASQKAGGSSGASSGLGGTTQVPPTSSGTSAPRAPAGVPLPSTPAGSSAGASPPPLPPIPGRTASPPPVASPPPSAAVPPVAGEAQASTATPPLPPPPVTTSAAPPVASAPEAGGDAASAVPDALAYPTVRVMVAAAMADGHMADEERAIFERHLADATLAPEALEQVRRDMALPPSPRDLAAMTSDPEARESLYRVAVLVLQADGTVSPFETGWLRRLGEAFGIDEKRARALAEDLFES